jgi:hypothetical protein
MMATCGWSRVLAARAHGTTLRAVARIVQRRVVARHAQHGGGDAHANAGLVHHVEHALQALARLTHQIAHGARAVAIGAILPHRELAFAEIEQRVGGAAPAQLVVQSGQRHVVAHAAQSAVGVDHFLGHDEQRNAARAGHQFAVGIRNLGQHQVDDVFGQLMLAAGDPHLVALEAVARAQWV